LEALVSEIKPAKKMAGLKARPLPEVKRFEEEFQRLLGRRVDIQTTGKKGWLKFEFYTPEDLENLCKKLGILS
jgi:hypothetical protein